MSDIYTPPGTNVQGARDPVDFFGMLLQLLNPTPTQPLNPTIFSGTTAAGPPEPHTLAVQESTPPHEDMSKFVPQRKPQPPAASLGQLAKQGGTGVKSSTAAAPKSLGEVMPVIGPGGIPTQSIPPADDNEYQQRLTGWRAFLSDPETQTALTQFGISMLSRTGPDIVSNIGKSLGDTAGALSRREADITAKSERTRKAGLEERKAQVEERKAGASEVTAQAAMIRARAALKSAGLKQNDALLRTVVKSVLDAAAEREQNAGFGGPSAWTQEQIDNIIFETFKQSVRTGQGQRPAGSGATRSNTRGAKGEGAKKGDPQQLVAEIIRKGRTAAAAREVLQGYDEATIQAVMAEFAKRRNPQ